MKILVVEDEHKIANLIKKGLEEQGYEVTVANDGLLGLNLATENNYDLMILDIILPGINGINLCRKIRKKDIATPVLILTALGTTDDKVTGLDSGADDYLVKPFNFNELLARIRALLRRNRDENISTVLTIGNLVLDTDAKKVNRGGKEIQLTAREFLLLELFLRNQGKVLNRAEIAGKVWDISFDTGTNIIDVYVNYLRNKIDKDFTEKLIHTVIGMGYVMETRTSE